MDACNFIYEVRRRQKGAMAKQILAKGMKRNLVSEITGLSPSAQRYFKRVSIEALCPGINDMAAATLQSLLQ